MSPKVKEIGKEQCEEVYTIAQGLKQHKEVKHEGIFYPCEICEFKTQYKQHLKIHKALKHGQVEKEIKKVKQKCDKCDEVYVSAQGLRQRKEVKHEGIFYPCEICEFKTQYKQD